MKFNGELKFPEIDHPGVPVTIVIENAQFEMMVEGESLGRWSLYDVHARRLVASAFQIDLGGTEVTFVADDPIDFAYSGVEHMAETWATLKSKRMATRGIAVRKSRQGTIPSRIDDLKVAMVANLETQTGSRQIAGEQSMPDPSRPETVVTEPSPQDWDRRDQDAAIPLIGPALVGEPEPTPVGEPAAPSEEARLLEEERLHLAEDRARLEEERRIAEQREADRVEAFRLEMMRLESEREELRRHAAELAERAAALEQASQSHPETAPEPAAATEPEPEAAPVDDLVPAPLFEPDPVLEPETERPTVGVLDLKHLEVEPPPPPPVTPPVTRPAPEPAMAGVGKEGRGGLMGAVRAAFKGATRDHEHRFVEAPGGIGITRYVCEECGYVSISV